MGFNVNSLSDKVLMSNNVGIPCLGFGTYKIDDDQQVYDMVITALEVGYRHIDTAAFYMNEAGVGRAINDFIATTKIAREDIFVTSKVWKTERGYDKTIKAFEKTMDEIGLDYIDLFLVHWPASLTFDDDWKEINRDTWRGMMDIYKSGKAKAIGVSNFLSHHLDTIIDMEIQPMVDQIEISPGFRQQDTVDYCNEHGIIVEAWSPLGRGRSLNHPLILELAEKYKKDSAQIIIRWDLQNGIIPLPKSINKGRVVSNADVFDFEISKEDMTKLNAMERYGDSGHHPDEAW
ncbi:MAG: aldo/keto reductase [Lachnospiraceae bacterium]|nr:aldo/keto reductase [Lachnospiraceae bacterium]